MKGGTFEEKDTQCNRRISRLCADHFFFRKAKRTINWHEPAHRSVGTAPSTGRECNTCPPQGFWHKTAHISIFSQSTCSEKNSVSSMPLWLLPDEISKQNMKDWGRKRQSTGTSQSPLAPFSRSTAHTARKTCSFGLKICRQVATGRVYTGEYFQDFTIFLWCSRASVALTVRVALLV